MIRGTTLFETILTVALIGILLSLFAAPLGDVRRRTRVTTSLAEIRHHAAVFMAYAVERRGEFPHYVDPDADFTILRWSGNAYPTRYFQAQTNWPIAMLGHYDTEFPFHDQFRSDINADFTYYYPHVFLAAPDHWRSTDHTGSDQWRATYMREVRHPSGKGILFDYSGWNAQDGRTTPLRVGGKASPVAFVDGSARAYRLTELNPAAGFPGADFAEEWAALPTPVMHTLDGVAGRDIP